MTRLGSVDHAGRKSLRVWVEEQGHVIDEVGFMGRWEAQGRRGGAEHQVFAYLHPVTGILAHDVHDENVVRLPDTEDFAVIDPYISLARSGSWAAIKLSEVGHPDPPDDPLPASQ